MKKFVSLLLCAVLVFCLAACGKDVAVPTDPTESQEGSSEPMSVLPDFFEEILINGNLVNVNELTVSNLVELGYSPTSSICLIYNDFVTLSGIGYKYTDGSEIIVCTNDNDSEKVTAVVVDDENASCVFFNEFHIGMPESYALEAVEGFDVDDFEFLGSKSYAVHNEKNSFVFTIDEGVVTEIISCISREAGVHSGGEDVSNPSYEHNLTAGNSNDHSTWLGYDSEVNYLTDMSQFVLEGFDFNFNELTMASLQEVGYIDANKFQILIHNSELINACAVVKDGSEITVVHTGSGEIEFLRVKLIDEDSIFYEAGDEQVECAFFGGLSLGMSVEEAKQIVNNDSFDWEDDHIFLRGESNCMDIELDDDKVVEIRIYNNKLCGYQ